jgi:hypothetical protein
VAVRTKRDRDLAAISKLWSLWRWHRCLVCGLEFRREPGWQSETGPYLVGPRGFRHGHTRAVCRGCCETKEEALDAIQEWAEHRAARRPSPHPRAQAPPQRPCQEVQGGAADATL